MRVDSPQLVALIERLNPQAWDAIFPHGPKVAVKAPPSRRARRDAGPQSSSADAELQAAAATTAGNVVQAAITAEAAGLDTGPKIVSKAIAAWCGTPPPPPPFPFPWPGPWPPPFSGQGEELNVDVGAAQMAGALTFASHASRMEEGKLRDALVEGADQLMETALSSVR